MAFWHYVLMHSAIAAVTHFLQKPFKVRRHQIMRMMERAEKRSIYSRPDLLLNEGTAVYLLLLYEGVLLSFVA